MDFVVESGVNVHVDLHNDVCARVGERAGVLGEIAVELALEHILAAQADGDVDLVGEKRDHDR